MVDYSSLGAIHQGRPMGRQETGTVGGTPTFRDPNSKNNRQQVVKALWRKAASPACHPSRRRINSSDLDPHIIHGLLHPHESAPLKRHLDRVRRFCVHHSKDSQCFTMRRTTTTISPYLRGIWTSSNTWFLGSTNFSCSNGISIDLAVFACSRTWQTDTQTHTDRQIDHVTLSVAVGRNR